MPVRLWHVESGDAGHITAVMVTRTINRGNYHHSQEERSWTAWYSSTIHPAPYLYKACNESSSIVDWNQQVGYHNYGKGAVNQNDNGWTPGRWLWERGHYDKVWEKHYRICADCSYNAKKLYDHWINHGQYQGRTCLLYA